MANQNVIIDQGATFYREVYLYSDAAKTIPLDITGKTPRSTLMTQDGSHVADFGCAILNAVIGKIAWTMAKSITANLYPKQPYIFNIDLDNTDGTTDRAEDGQVTVKCGQR